jgi:hypothetical protein
MFASGRTMHLGRREVAASVTRRRSVMAGTAGALAVLACSAPATAQDRDSTLKALASPTVSGTTMVGNLLMASGGSWASPQPWNTSTRWEWYRCNNPFAADCRLIVGNQPTYRLDVADGGKWIAVAKVVRFPANADCRPSTECLFMASAARGPVVLAPTPTPTPTVVATPEPTPEPTPVPFVATPAPTPAANQGPLLSPPGPELRMMRPKPTVRVRGTLSTRGANLTLLSVRAPKRSRITVTCKGSGCPRSRYTTRQRTARARVFERNLPAGTRLEIRVQRTGYYGKSTVLRIRRGKAPFRLDRCLSASGAYTACPRS